MKKGTWLAILLLVGAGLVSCGPAATAVSVTPMTAAPSLTARLSVTAPAPSPTPPPAPPATASAAPIATAFTTPPQAPATPTCEAAEQWSQTQDDLTLFLCFKPYPPQLGIPVNYEAVLVDSAGQPLSDATVELTVVGGMAGMEGEHDEDFPVALVSQGAGLYAAQATVGPTDLVLTEIRIGVRLDRRLWSFSFSANELVPG